MTSPARAILLQAQALWAGRFQGLISTHSQAQPGYPFGSLVPYCLDREGRPLLLLSHLAQHTRNLLADPRCAFSLHEPTGGDVQQVLRLTALAQCQPVAPEDPAEVERYLRYYPASRPYWEQLNFLLFRLEPLRFHLNGGFAAARWAAPADILESNPFSPAQEAALLDTLAGYQGEALRRRIRAQHPGATWGEPLEILGVDGSGIDLRGAEAPLRLSLPAVVRDGEALLRLLEGA